MSRPESRRARRARRGVAPTAARTGAAVAAGASLAVVAAGAHAGGFSLIEHGASGLGNAYAGAAAIAEDGSTIWFNPAGMTELPDREITVAGHVLDTKPEWEDRGTSLSPALGGGPASGPDTAEPGTTSFVPNFYYSAPIGDRWHYGLGIGVPYGSSTEYDSNWKGRYTTIESGVNVIDINPSVAYRVSDKVRVGGGISLQLLSADLTSAVDSGAVCLAAVADRAACVNAGLVPGVQENDGRGEITGDSTAVTINLGALFLPRDGTRIGVAFRSGASHELDGDGDFTTNAALRGLLDEQGGPTAALLTDSGADAEIDLPPMLSLSAVQDVGANVRLLADLTWTGWSSFQELRVDYDNPAQPDTVSIQDYDDVFRAAVAVNWQQSPKLLLRAGLAFDEEAIPGPERRTARIPGNDRTWLAFGAGYRFSENLSVDAGYTHLFLPETAIDNRNLETTGGEIVRGVYESSVDIFSAQLRYQFR